jgi:hypothetical protein
MSANRDDRIDRIVGMMLNAEWKGCRSHRELAAEWRCHPRTVGDLAMSAAAVCRRLAGADAGLLIQQKLAELEHIADVAMSMYRPDVKAAERAVRSYLEVLGAFNHVRRVVEMTPEEVRKKTDGELWARVDELRAQREGKH